MKTLALLASLALVTACGSSSTDTSPTRYNFAVINGRNQISNAGAITLAQPITSQLTRDPQGKFATRVFDFLAPEAAYAQGLSLAGTPVADAIVCGRVAPSGEPQVVPLCAFTLADGTAANVVQGGTKAGTYNILFTAQVPAQEPVVDSTTVVVKPGPMTVNSGFAPGNGFGCWMSPAAFPTNALQDQYGNGVPYRFVVTGVVAHAGSAVIGEIGAETLIADKDGTGSVDVETDLGKVASAKLTVAGSCISLQF